RFSVQEVLFGFQSAMVYFCRLIPRRIYGHGVCFGHRSLGNILFDRMRKVGKTRSIWYNSPPGVVPFARIFCQKGLD
ncbi:MAG: hypothetical protein ACOYYJ_12755, partial [Chloroflexota bacterium]